MEQMTIFDLMNEEFHINKPIRLIELFGGIGSQAMALKSLGLDFESYRLVEIDKYAVASYNAIHGTDFVPTDITQLKGEDLGIVDTDKYIYLLTYSFPCQSLSVAGLGHGMEEGSGTRSSLLWEVKRLLTETKNKPQILLMENVPQVHSEGKNLKSFIKWQQFLESLGYISFTEDIQANQYVAQSRNRCFCISLLGKYTYHFPQGHTCDKVMKDYLEDEVDEKYYITSEKAYELIDKLVKEGKIPLPPQYQRKCAYCDNLIGRKGSLGMCNKHYIQYKRHGDPLYTDKKPRATIDGYYRDPKSGRREHRVIWENHYNEKLSKEEVIHHINFVKTDNRIENLWKYANASEHIKAHREYERLMESLESNEEIIFENGSYIKRERERERERDND